ncbi:hypothetical protein [Streptomyces marianii]|uniref:Uncharacterized protein n=1 Tax=Streptomyces marianii TaxID=1817406 RepID=A0A5R9DX23_9ACTN|nr:hypothetical protein [Streptomyces marianii]TLQ39412.1 hypothetical protein FEF34_39225 [Streptomyces marianii]
MSKAPRQATAAETRHLKAASADPHGHLPVTVSARLLKAMLEAGFIYREDRDGFRLASAEALAHADGTWRITLAGRRAALTAAQWRTLTERVAEDGAFTTRVNWVTKDGLAAVGLAEYRDDEGVVQPHDGSSGVLGPRFRCYRTELGLRVAQLADEDELR